MMAAIGSLRRNVSLVAWLQTLLIEPPVSRSPPDCVAAMPSAQATCRSSSPSAKAHAAAEPSEATEVVGDHAKR